MEGFSQNGTMQRKAVVMGLYWKDNLPLFSSSPGFLRGNMFLSTAHVK